MGTNRQRPIFACVLSTVVSLFLSSFAGAAPINDAYSGSINVSGARFSISGDNSDATSQAGEPVHGNGAAGKSLWYSWTAPFSGRFVVSATASNHFPVLAVYSGTLPALAAIGNESSSPPFYRRRVTVDFVAQAGVTYQIAVDGFAMPDSASAGEFVLEGAATTLRIIDPLPHETIPGGQPCVAEVSAPDAAEGELERVDYYWKDTFGNSVLAGSSEVAPFAAELSRPKSGSYRLVATGIFANGEAHSPEVPVNLQPANDDFADAEVRTGYRWTAGGSTAGATGENSEPSHGGRGSDASIWYTWQAPSSGEVTLEMWGVGMANSGSDAYTGASLQALQRVPATVVANVNHVRIIRFPVTIGTTYQIAIQSQGQESRLVGPPTVTVEFKLDSFHLIHPTAGDYVGPGPIPLRVFTSEPAGAIQRVDYYSQNVPFYTQTLIGSSTQAPFGVDWSATPGVHLILARATKVDGTVLESPGATIHVLPGNDHFANRTVLVGDNINLTGGAAFSSVEPGEPSSHGNHSVWFTWTAPAAGMVIIPNAYGVRVYSGDTLSQLTLVAQSDSSADLRVQCSSGNTFQIAVLANDLFTLRLRLYPRPVNNDFGTTAPATGTNALFSGYNIDATSQSGEPAIGVGGKGRTIWFSWTAPADGNAILSDATRPSGPPYYNSINIGVYHGASVDALDELIAGEFSGTVPFCVYAGETYHIAIDDRASGLTEVEIALNFIPAPPNDKFINRIRLEGENPIIHFASAGATSESYDGNTGVHTLWWEWTAPVSCAVHFATYFPYYGGAGSVFKGNSADTLELVATGNAGLSFEAQAGTTYQIVIGSNLGRFVVVDIPVVVLDNDHFANARPITGVSEVLQGTCNGATMEPGEPDHDGWGFTAATIWWRWTATVSGRVKLVDKSGANHAPALVAYTGSAVNALTPVPNQQQNLNKGGGLEISVVSGTTYYIGVEPKRGSAEIHLQWSVHVPKLVGVNRGSGNQLSLALGEAEAGRSVRIDTSEDLVHWTALRTETLSQGQSIVEIPPVTGNQRFYRLVPLP